MASWVKLIGVKEVAEGSARAVTIGDRVVAVFRVNGAFYALENQCLHRQGPLGEGEIDGGTVVCPWHGWHYDLATGALSLIPTLRVGRYDVEVRGEDVYVSLPDSIRQTG